MRLHRRVEGVEDRALPEQDRDRRHDGACSREPEGGPPEAASGDPSQAFRGEHVAEPHDEERREHERHQHAVRRHRQVIERLAPHRKIDVGDRERLQHAHRRGDGERRDGDADMRERERMPVGHSRGAHFTITLPTIAWCIRPQYSLQAIVCSPGVSNVTVNWVTYPGTAIALAFVPTIWNPCTTSLLVTRKVTGTWTGTSIGSGENANIEATTGTTTLPSGRLTMVGVPNSGFVAMVVGSTVSTWPGGSSACAAVVSRIVVRNAAISAPEAHIQTRS